MLLAGTAWSADRSSGCSGIARDFAGLTLTHVHNVVPHMLPAHSDDIGAPLTSIKAKRQRQPRPTSDRVPGFEGSDVQLGPGIKAIGAEFRAAQAFRWISVDQPD